MTYVRFSAKNSNDGRQGRNIYVKRKNENNIIYAASYPPRIEKRKYTSTKYEKDTETESMIENIVEAQEDGESHSKYDQTTSLSKIMCGVLSAVLIYTGVYLSGIRPPKYIEKGAMNLIEWARKSEDKEINAASVSEAKVIGEKIFVSQEENNIEDTKQQPEAEIENARFAKSVIKNGTKNAEVSAEVFTMNETQPDEKEVAVEVIAKNMSSGSDKIYCTNRTSLKINGGEYLEKEYPIEKYNLGSGGEPLVLIVHTHGTESYIDSGDNGNTRTNDVNRNIVRIGTELCSVLEQYGIPVIHSKTMHDEISYVSAYENSRKEIKDYLKKYPSIKYVIDVHRDALGEQGGVPVKTYTEINGEPTAQLMLVMGTNAGGGNHPEYEKNLTVAAHIQDNANQLYPGLMRALNIRASVFNQNLASGGMILEVGSDANTMNEAMAAIRMFGRCFAQTVGSSTEDAF